MKSVSDIYISSSQVKKIRLRYLRLARRTRVAEHHQLHELIAIKKRHFGHLMGIRRMTYHIRQECRVWVGRKTIWDALKVVDMEGLLDRRRHRLQRRIFHADGPDQVWSLDGHDKIARWGFPIHGCNDVFSRYLLWLRVGSSNHDPRYILAFYLDALEENARISGSENCNPLSVWHVSC